MSEAQAPDEPFRVMLARRLAPLGFEARARHQSLVRKRGKDVHRVEFRSRRDWESLASEWPSLFVEDAATRKLVKGWRAGGSLGQEDFGGEGRPSAADAQDPSTLAAFCFERLSFFDWMDDPEAVLRDVSARYVLGLTEPVQIAPYLRTRLGAEAVASYAQALLDGRPELAPAFLTELASLEHAHEARLDGAGQLDHGAQLARVVHAYAEGRALHVPSGTVRSTLKTARHLRCFFGRQLRAWGETAIAHELHRVEDAAIQATYEREEEMRGRPLLREGAAGLVIELVTGTRRPPRNAEPKPRLFQYHSLMAEPFGRSS